MSFTQRCARTLLRLLGWRLLDLPERPAKAVAIAYPHTSNWDFPYAMLGLFALGVNPRWVGKDSLFRGLYGPLMRSLGGIAVNRRERTGFVGRMAEVFAQHEQFMLCIAPEGTRSLAEGWKSGFYRIAVAANVPLVAATIDYKRKELGLIEVIRMSGDETSDMHQLQRVYAGRLGHNPAKASPIRLLK